MNSEQVIVVGGGIVGLAVARELLLRRPESSVTVFEKEDRLAAHQSGRNSGVVHAGVYYAAGSLKARLCRRGGAMLREFCQDNNVSLRELGKLIVATEANELSGLAEIERRARANLVADLRPVAPEEMRDVEPYVRGLAALHSPHTASVDYIGMCEALGADIRSRGGEVLLSTPVESISHRATRVEVRSPHQRWMVDRLVVCAGLQSDRLAAQVGAEGDMGIVPFRGEYYDLAAAARHKVRGMIYPVPDPRYPFLGVHLTRDVHDRVHVGPNAVLALALEGYRWRDVDVREVLSVAGWPGTWRLARKHWRSGVEEVAASLSKRLYLRRVRAYLPELELDDLAASVAGVRAQAVRRNGDLVDDFAVHSSGRISLVRNAPSPAATSSLAIAEYVVDKAFSTR
ncbi:MAG: L-2-hydroxyglutarate oxidase [Actinomycetota bacterium]|nr:L-2-hydroxyglutarate oxidase [Actinomycetota bacterium]